MSESDAAVCARLWPNEPWPDAVLPFALINAFAAVGVYRSAPTDPPF